MSYMSNNKIYFEFKRRTSKIYDFFFSSHSKKKLQLLFISKVYHFYLFKKNLNYNRRKLLTLTPKKKKKALWVYSKTSVYMCVIVRTSFDLDSKIGLDSGPTSPNNKFVEHERKN